MLFRIAEKTELKTLFGMLAEKNTVVGPVQTGTDRKGKPLFAFEQVSDFDKLQLGLHHDQAAGQTVFSPLSRRPGHLSDRRQRLAQDHRLQFDRPYVFFGLHACDINALNKLDKVLMGSVYPMPYYAAKRKNMFIIGIGCQPQPFCFCRSMGADTVLHGFDLFITDIGDRYFIEILSADGLQYPQERQEQSARRNPTISST